MGLPSGTHDKRTFRHYAKLAEDGTVAAIVELADGAPDLLDGDQSDYVEVTDLHPYDFTGMVLPSARGRGRGQRDHASVKADLARLNRVPRG